MPAISRYSTHQFSNRSGGAFPINSLVAVEGYDAQSGRQQCVLAQANGTGRRADGFVDHEIGNNRTGYYYRDFRLVGTAANPVDTSLGAVGDPVYLSPVVPGGWTLDAPGAGEDYQEVGSVLLVNAVTGQIRINLAAGGVVGFAPDGISEHVLEFKPVHSPANPGCGWLRFTGAVADGDRVSINGRIYEFDTAAPPGALGAGADVRVGVSGAGGDPANTAAGCATAMAAALNGDTEATALDALVIGGANIVALSTPTAGANLNYALSAPVNVGGNIVVSGANLIGSEDAGSVPRIERAHIMTAAEIATMAETLGTSEALIAVFGSTTEPHLGRLQAFRASGAGNTPVTLDGLIAVVRQINANFWGLCLAQPAAGAILQAGDLVAFTLSYRT